MGHELGHVVQQKEGRVIPTVTVNGIAVNDDVGLEVESDRMIADVQKMPTATAQKMPAGVVQRVSVRVVQRICPGCGKARCDGSTMNCTKRKLDQPVPDELEYTTSAMATTCTVSILDIGDYKFESGGGKHAEEHAIDFLTKNAGSLSPGICQVLFTISKSLCSSTSTPKTDNG